MPDCPYCGLAPIPDGHIADRHGITDEQHELNEERARAKGAEVFEFVTHSTQGGQITEATLRKARGRGGYL